MKNEERRAVNIPHRDYELIKKYCEQNALSMPRWIALLATTHIKQQTVKQPVTNTITQTL